jgi:hypothetical protein
VFFEAGYVNVHLLVEAIIENEVVGHPYAVGLHRMALAVVIITNLRCFINHVRKIMDASNPQIRARTVIEVADSVFGGRHGLFQSHKPPKGFIGEMWQLVCTESNKQAI